MGTMTHQDPSSPSNAVLDTTEPDTSWIDNPPGSAATDPTVLAVGFGSGGERWTLTAIAKGRRLQTMVEVIETDGRRWAAGSGGVALHEGRRVDSFAGRSGASSHLVILRLAPEVRAVVATLSDGTREDLRLHGEVERLGVQLAVLVYPAPLDLHTLVLIGADGTELPAEL
jgi:hypothetical protein